ncbi:MAG: hypothetical protein IJZ89_03560 [Clostridia bacterium]|nr:hypothetical protein [Clostridia bacterium]
MLKVLPIQSKTEQEAICARCGIKYDVNLLAYSATLDDKLAGICQFTMNSDGGSIRDLALAQGCENSEVLFVLGRATLNFIDLTGVHKAYYDAPVSEENEMLIRRIGFCKNDDGRFFVDLTNFFVSPCQHDKK